jgi:hypothetical protein
MAGTPAIAGFFCEGGLEMNGGIRIFRPNAPARAGADS